MICLYNVSAAFGWPAFLSASARFQSAVGASGDLGKRVTTYL